MTHTNHPLPAGENARTMATARTARSAARRRHASHFSDAVVAAYIHEISTRHPRPRPAGQSGDRRVRA
ncbi:MAG: hypothetical protein QOC95_2189 [Thermoleophilaceae bacterium]|jgi:hypothetical protein|nr:hypothetical protein [Thermoleophilaceae bacterium]